MKTDWINYSTSTDSWGDEGLSVSCLLWAVVHSFYHKAYIFNKDRNLAGDNECTLCNNATLMTTNEILSKT